MNLKTLTIPSRLLMVLAILCTVFFIQAQIPPSDEVVNTFRMDYPYASKIRWTKTEMKGKEYKVRFVSGKEKITAYYNASGRLIESDKPIDPALLPEPVLKAMETQFGKYSIQQSYVIERNGNANLYEIAYKCDGNKSTIVVSKDGYFTSR